MTSIHPDLFNEPIRGKLSYFAECFFTRSATTGTKSFFRYLGFLHEDGTVACTRHASVDGGSLTDDRAPGELQMAFGSAPSSFEGGSA